MHMARDHISTFSQSLEKEAISLLGVLNPEVQFWPGPTITMSVLLFASVICCALVLGGVVINTISVRKARMQHERYEKRLSLAHEVISQYEERLNHREKGRRNLKSAKILPFK